MSWDLGERRARCLEGHPPHLLLPGVPALLQASGSEGRDPWPPRRAHQGAAGAGANSEWAHQGAETQVSSGPSMAPPSHLLICCLLSKKYFPENRVPSLQLIFCHFVLYCWESHFLSMDFICELNDFTTWSLSFLPLCLPKAFQDSGLTFIYW